ncbi:MAG: arsenate reductase ArsC [Smithellaceae bacterium]
MRFPKKSVLFICTHNAVRSQMAEVLLNNIFGDRYTAFSAGSDPMQMDPLVTSVMSEIGIDVSNHRSKGLDVFKDSKLDYIVTVCDQAHESCPYFPGGNLRLHRSFPDPSRFSGKYEDRIKEYRCIRDEIKKWIEKEFNFKM